MQYESEVVSQYRETCIRKEEAHKSECDCTQLQCPLYSLGDMPVEQAGGGQQRGLGGRGSQTAVVICWMTQFLAQERSVHRILEQHLVGLHIGTLSFAAVHVRQLHLVHCQHKRDMELLLSQNTGTLQWAPLFQQCITLSLRRFRRQQMTDNPTTTREDYEGSNPAVICYTCFSIVSPCRLTSEKLDTSGVMLTGLLRVNILAIFVNEALQ